MLVLCLTATQQRNVKSIKIVEKSVDNSLSSDILEQLKAYLKEKLEVSMSATNGKLEVEIQLDGEVIAKDSEYICDIVGEKDNW